MFLYTWIKFIIGVNFFILCFASYAQERNIVVTLPYLKDLVDNILCKAPEYKTISIITAGIDPHTFILTPNDRIRLKNANTVIQIGTALEFWMDKIKFDSIQNHIVLNERLLIQDTHIWQSPKITEKVVNILAENFIKQNFENKNNIENCAQTYILKIHSTVADLKKQLSLIPKENRVIATNHDSFRYFAEAFDFKIYSILGLSDEEQPNIKQLKYLITLLRQQHIKSVFLESTGNPKNILILAKNANVTIGGKLYGDSLGEKGSGADTTLGMWQTNVSTLVKALK